MIKTRAIHGVSCRHFVRNSSRFDCSIKPFVSATKLLASCDASTEFSQANARVYRHTSKLRSSLEDIVNVSRHYTVDFRQIFVQTRKVLLRFGVAVLELCFSNEFICCAEILVGAKNNFHDDTPNLMNGYGLVGRSSCLRNRSSNSRCSSAR